MAGMLYSLVALGFVLIFKASGVFNSRRARWCCSRAGHGALRRVDPGMDRHHQPVVRNGAAFIIAGAIMFGSRLAGRKTGACATWSTRSATL
jgi:hypothetical protein